MIETIRDMAVILLSLMGIAAFAVVLVVALLLYKKLSPLLTAATHTVNHVRGTTAFIAETTVHPIIRIASTVAGIRAAASAVGGFRRRRGGKP